MKLSLRPRHFKRYKGIARLVLKYARMRRSNGEARGLPRAEDLAADLERMGPTYVKLGQLLSTRGDLLPPAYLDALSRLQDRVEPFSSEEAERILCEELGVRSSDLFREFDPEPIAAASLAQVHRATLRDGRRVAVKIQRPGIRPQIVEDLQALMELAEFFERHTQVGRRYEFLQILQEIHRSLLRELDYELEARNFATLGLHLQGFERICVPRTLDEWTTTHVLTMDHVEGKKITAVTPEEAARIGGPELADQLFRAYLKQILVDGFFHADPHPGNVILTPDHRLALLDLGMVARVREDLQDRLLEMLVAIAEGRGREAGETALRIAERKEGADPDGFVREVAELVAQNRDVELAGLQVGKIVLSVLRISGQHGIRLPAEFTMLEKAMLNLDQVGRILDPAFDPSEAIRRSVPEILKLRTAQAVTVTRALASWIDVKELVGRLPSRLSRILDLAADNQLEVKVDAIDEAKLIGGFQKIANRVTLGLILAAIIMGAALLMRVETSFRILGYPGLAMIFFMIAAGGGLALALSIVLGDERVPKWRRKRWSA